MKTALLALYFLIGFVGIAQDHIDIFQSYYRFSPNNNSEYYKGVHYIQYGGELKAPIVLKNSDAVILGLEYNAHIFQSTQGSIPFSESLHESKLLFGIKHHWNNKWNTLAFYIPKLNGDYQSQNKNQFQNGGLILNSFKKNENLDLKFGAYFNQESFGPMLVPLLGWNWKINDKWRFKGMVPVSLEVIYSREKSNYGFSFIGKNASFFKANDMGVSIYADMADNNAWLFAEFNVAKNWLIHFKAGHSVLRTFRYFVAGDEMTLKVGPANVGDDRVKFEPWFKDGFSFETRLIFRLPTH